MTDKTNDFGKPRKKNDTMGGYSRYEVNSLLQKAIRRSDEDIAAWCAWELCRSGHGWNFWDRMALYIVEDLAAGVPQALTIRQYERLASQRWSMDGEQGVLAAIHAAIDGARARSAREATYANDYFDKICKDRRKAIESDDHDQLYALPVDVESLKDTDHEFGDPVIPDGAQATLGSGGMEIDHPTNDFGETLRAGETAYGFHEAAVRDRMHKAVLDNEEEAAAFCAWELTRSGWGSTFWDQIHETALRTLDVGTQIPLLIDRYDALANKKWSPDGWEGKLCAIHAALTVVRADNTQYATETMGRYVDEREERVAAREEGRDPEFNHVVNSDSLSPDGKFAVAIDKHTLRGKRRGRDWPSFKISGARVGPKGETDLGDKWGRRSMEMDGMGYREVDADYSRREINWSYEPVDENDRWHEPYLDR